MAPHSVLLPGKSHGQRSPVGCSPWGREESDTTERLHFHFSLSCIGEGSGNPLWCSCLENPRDGGAWWAAVCGVAQSRHDWSSSSIALCIYSCFHLQYKVCFVLLYYLWHLSEPTTVHLFVGNTEINDIIPAHRGLIWSQLAPKKCVWKKAWKEWHRMEPVFPQLWDYKEFFPFLCWLEFSKCSIRSLYYFHNYRKKLLIKRQELLQ